MLLKIFFKLFPQCTAPYYEQEGKIVYSVLNVYARAITSRSVAKDLIQKQLTRQITEDLMKHGLIKFQEQVVGTRIEYQAHLVVVKK